LFATSVCPKREAGAGFAGALGAIFEFAGAGGSDGLAGGGAAGGVGAGVDGAGLGPTGSAGTAAIFGSLRSPDAVGRPGSGTSMPR